jgi:hypothetical protein
MSRYWAARSVDSSDPAGLSCSVAFAVFSGSVAVRWRRVFSIGINGRSVGAIGRYIAGSMAASSRWCAFLGILYGDVGIWSILASQTLNLERICTDRN